jgi:hypothetical protein
MSLQGADPDQLEDLVRSCSDASTRFASIASSLDAQLGRSPWQGPRADQFRADWRSRHAGALRSASVMLGEMSKVLAVNAAEQRRASDATGAGGVGANGSGLFRGIPGAFASPGARGPIGRWFDPTDLLAGHVWSADVSRTRGSEVYGHDLHGSALLVGGIAATGSAGVSFLSASAGTNASASLGADGLRTTAGANAEADLIDVRTSGHVGNDTVSVDAGGEARVGAHGNAEVGASVGPSGVDVTGGADAFVGGEASAHVGADLGGFKPSAVASVSYGIGAHAHVGGHLDAHHVGASFDLGATLGVGGGVKVDVDVDPVKVGHTVGHATSAAVHSVGHFLHL